MTDKIIVFVTCETKEQAESIAQALVTEKLAACVNMLPKMWSCYMWKGELNWSEEFQLLIKTTQGTIRAIARANRGDAHLRSSGDRERGDQRSSAELSGLD